MERKVIMITSAGRGLGTYIAKAAPEAGHAVVATGHNTDAVKTHLSWTRWNTLGEAKELLVVARDITSPEEAQ